MNTDFAATASPLSLPRPRTGLDWDALGRAYLFFWYFSGVTHLLLVASGATGFSPLRHGLLNSLLWLVPLLAFPRQGVRLAGLIGLALWAFSLVNLGYFAIYRQEFSQSVLFILFDSNPAEASEYIGNYFAWWMVPALLAYSAGAWWLWRRLRPLTMPRRAAWSLALAILALIALPGTYRILYKNKGLDANTFSRALANSLEPAVPWQFAVGYFKYEQQLTKMHDLLERNRRLPPVANLADAHAGQPATLVLAIGESTSRLHMSLYGYGRQTSPRLEAMRDRLTVFNRVVASRPYTIETLQQALTFADQEHPDLYLTRPSLMNIMKQAGYKTYWVTNQQTLTMRNTMLTNFSEQADEQVYLNHSRSQNSYRYDGNVLDPFSRILTDKAERKFIVVHLLGTHMIYEYRYPPEFNVFKDRSGLPEWVTDRQLPLINHYDNAVRYNDHVLASLIERLDSLGGKSMLLYFSDHGEDVFDSPAHDFIGRNEARPTLPMYAVPFLLWRSAAWQQARGRNFDKQVDRPYQTSHLIHTWADLAGLSFDDYDPSKSVVNARFRERPLLVGNPGSQKALVDLSTLPPH
ncbi:MAG: phosphoethanolamine transferase CptA [Betaproteobacteria bacterium]|nr:phosphoethanolamine transferase CptA [Betaproteobacteria bacterium]